MLGLIICAFFSQARRTDGSFVRHSTDVVDPERFLGEYCNCLWKKAEVKLNPDQTVLLTIGSASGLLRNQQNNAFLWWGENYGEPMSHSVVFGENTIFVSLMDERGQYVEFVKGCSSP